MRLHGSRCDGASIPLDTCVFPVVILLLSTLTSSSLNVQVVFLLVISSPLPGLWKYNSGTSFGVPLEKYEFLNIVNNR